MNDSVVFVSTNYSTNTTIEIELPLYDGNFVEEDGCIVVTLMTEEQITFEPTDVDGVYYAPDNNLYFFKDYHVGDLLKYLEDHKEALN